MWDERDKRGKTDKINLRDRTIRDGVYDRYNIGKIGELLREIEEINR